MPNLLQHVDLLGVFGDRSAIGVVLDLVLNAARVLDRLIQRIQQTPGVERWADLGHGYADTDVGV